MGRTVKVKFDSREPELKELLERVMPDVEVFFGDTLFTALNITAQKCRARNNPESKDLSAKFDEMLITNGDYIFSDIDSRLIDKKESVSDYAELTGENYYACISISKKEKSKEEITRELLEKIKDKPLSEIRKDENYPLVEITKGDFKGQKIYQNQLDALEDILGKGVNKYHLKINNGDLVELLLRVNLTKLPESIGNLSALQRINLEHNQLTSLPESIGNLTALQKINLWSNQLKSLPESIGNLTALQKINLRYNQLTSLPESIGNLTALQGIYLEGNPLLNIFKRLKNLEKKGLQL